MADPAQEYPLEDQWGLLVEHRIEYLFHGLWVESGDVDEVSALLRVDPDSRRECGLETATEAFQTSSGEMVWMGAHSAGWTHVLAHGLYPYHPAIRNLGKRRVLEVHYNDHLRELEPVNLYYDGEQVGDVTPPYEEGGYIDLPDYRPYTSGIELGDALDLSRCVHLMLCMVGRITGRFLDREWVTSTRALHRIPEGTWQESW
ncbi:hypothetical protein AB0F88_35490 [Streptosporangium sp. NPDC023963]|uniref:hypothetical protein n=1 Tax=Streptosporangium sp. NPDC023963 TaxID=3155608 RepID=UPI003432F437